MTDFSSLHDNHECNHVISAQLLRKLLGKTILNFPPNCKMKQHFQLEKLHFLRKYSVNAEG